MTRVLGFGNHLSTLVLGAHPRWVRIKATSSAETQRGHHGHPHPRPPALLQRVASPPRENVSSEQEGCVDSHVMVIAWNAQGNKQWKLRSIPNWFFLTPSGG